MTPTAPLLEVARIDRAHGVRGDVLVTLISTESARLAVGAVLDAGERGELVVAESRPHQQRYIVHFEGVADKAAADALRGTVLRAPAFVDDDPDALWAHEVIGAEVVDVEGRSRGTVVAMIDNPASDLLELANGALVPLTFVTGWDEHRRLVVDPPAGLFDDD